MGTLYRRGILSKLDDITSRLNPKSSANPFEDSLQKLGEMIGYQCEEPEYLYGECPDVLWRIEKENF